LFVVVVLLDVPVDLLVNLLPLGRH
jgi:hypothetical protein